MRKNYTKASLLLSVLIIILVIGCKRESVLDNPIDSVPPTPTSTVVNDLTQVTANVSGIVLDESNAPIASAVVTSGGATTTTNSNGMFIFQNISLSKENGSVTVVKAGYFKGIRSFKTTAGKNHTVRLQLMQKVLSGTVNAAAGGTINSTGGASIIFPAAAFVTSTGAAYTGTVNVYSRWINPTAANLPSIIPGDLRGVGINGAENILETYGMVGAELEDASGNPLKIATGKKATISFPLPPSLQASAPANIQLWHFDDATARWKENGTATKTGTTYTAQVDKFSFWNVDVGTTNFINLDYILINAITNSPLVSTNTRIKRITNGNYGYGISNNLGFVSGLVPKNEMLVMEVINCGAIVYSQNIGPFSSNTTLGQIGVNLPSSQYTNFIGTVVNCANSPVSNGYVSFYSVGGSEAFVDLSLTGSFSFTIMNCNGGSLAYSYQARDYSTSQQSPVLTGISTSSTVNLGNIIACGLLAGTDVFVAGNETSPGFSKPKLWKNTIGNYLPPNFNQSYAKSVYVSGNDVYVAGNELNNSGLSIAKLWKNGIDINLPSINASAANSVFVSGTDVYVTGYEINSGTKQVKLWKNGISMNLNVISGSFGSEGKSVFVSGLDVFVAGYEQNSSGNYFAKIWKNSISTTLSSTSILVSANSVYVSGADIYVVGNESFTSGGNTTTFSKIWKNGIGTYLTTNTNQSEAWSVFVSGSDVYVAGYEKDASLRPIAKIWKNAVGTNLSTTTGSSSTAYSIFVSGPDVYAAGYEQSGGGGSGFTARVWKNGLATTLTPDISAAGAGATSIFVR